MILHTLSFLITFQLFNVLYFFMKHSRFTYTYKYRRIKVVYNMFNTSHFDCISVTKYVK